MASFIKKLFAGSVGLVGLGVGGAETLFHLLSHRNGNVDFVLKSNKKESALNREIRLRREADYNWLVSQPLKHYYITTQDGLKLHATLLPADIPSDNYVFAVHGYRCNGNKEFDSIARYYHELGINVFMIDQRASGLSEGTYITFGAKEHEDCLEWLSFMLHTFGDEIKIILHGCSMGSATVMMLLGYDLPTNVIFAVSDCGYSTAREQLEHNFSDFKIPARLAYSLYRQAAIRQADFDPDYISPIDSVSACTIPVIFAHGTADRFVPFDMVNSVYEACASDDKCLIAVKGAAHVQSFQVDDTLKNTIKEYINKYIN